MIMKAQHTITYRHMKTVLTGKFTAVNAPMKRIEQPQISSLAIPLKVLERQEQSKYETNRRKEKQKLVKLRLTIQLMHLRVCFLKGWKRIGEMGGKRRSKKIEMQYVYVLILHDECVYYAS